MRTSRTKKEKFKGIVRHLEEKDIPALRKISEYWLRDGEIIAYDEVEKDMATLRESLKKGSNIRMFVAQSIEGKSVGMMGVALQTKAELLEFAKTDHPSELIVAYVHPNYTGGKRVGIGTALINSCQNVAKKNGKKEILLESGPRHTHTGYPFYDKQPGFKRVGEIKDFYGPGEHTVVWQKTF